MTVICFIFSIFLSSDEITPNGYNLSVKEKEFHSMDECARWINQQIYMLPYEGIQSRYYCKEIRR